MSSADGYAILLQKNDNIYVKQGTCNMTHIVQSEQELLDTIRDVLVNKLHPVRIYLFGSRAAGNHNAHSDFDIAIEGSEVSFRALRRAKETIDEVLGIYSCDVVTLEKTSRDFQDLVREQGKILYERD